MKVFLAAIVVLGAASTATAQTSLAWKLKGGEEFILQVEQLTSSTATVVNKSVKTTVEMTLQSAWSVEEVNDGVAKIRQRVTRATVQVQAADAPPVEFDTAQESQPGAAARDFAAALKPLVDPQASILLVMNERGEILSAALSPKLAEAWTAGQQDDSVSKSSATSLETLLKQPLVVLPDKLVSKGDKWQTTRELLTPAGKFNQVTQYTYQGPQDASGTEVESADVQVIAYAATLTAAAPSKTKLIEQSQTGTARFDADAGRLLSSEQTQKLVTETPYREAAIRVIIESRVKRSLQAKVE